ncbi:MAG: DUF4290 domain-containing protein [Bacteroidales bacterium]|nr:DUF4290 domain-containing protein [Bacteroidales bacterium]
MLEYNTSRNKLIIREYGRNIQKMIEDAVKIEDREKRNEAAKAIVKAMSLATTANGNVSNTQIQKERESIDYWRKLWDHLFIISNYQLDVDSPFPKPQPSEKEHVSIPHEEYKKDIVRTRSYGRYLGKIIQAVSAYPEGPQKQHLARNIANQMKRLYLKFNRDTVDDTVIVGQLKDLSHGKLVLPDDFELIPAKELLTGISQQPSKTAKKKKKKKKKKQQTSTNA